MSSQVRPPKAERRVLELVRRVVRIYNGSMVKEKTIAATEFKAKCLAILDELDSNGIVVTKHGRPIARLVPVERTDPDRRREAVERLKVFADGRTLGVPVKQLINQGRR